MSLWIIYTLSIFTFVLHCHCYDHPTARILDVGVPPWKPVPAYHTAVGPQYISIGALNPTNNLHFSQISQHNAQLMQQVKGFNAPVTQYRNPFPMFQPATQAHHNHHHFTLPKDNVQHLHTSASNIAQTVLPSNYLKPAFITGKPAFNLKPEYITKPEFYNGIHTTLAKNPQVPGFKQIPTSFKDAMASFFQESSPYKDFVLGQPQQQFQNQGQILTYKPQQQFKDKPVGSFSFPNDGVGSLTFFGPASHLIRGGSKPLPPKPQPTIFFPAEIGSNFRNGQQFAQPNRQLFSKPPQLFQSVQPIRYESSTPSFFGSTSVKISPSQSYELTISKTPDGREVVSTSTVAPLPQQTESPISLQHSEQVKSQVLPPIPASVLTPFFHQIQQQQSANANIIHTVQKDRFIKDEYSEHLVPPPYIQQESSTFRTTPYSPTRRPIAHQEQANALNILNKYNIPIISPLQDAAKFKYDDIPRKPTIIPLNYTVSSIAAYPTNAPQNTPLSIQPTGVLGGVETFTNANFNNHNFFENNAYVEHFGRPSTSRNPPIPQKDTFNSEHTFFTVNDALTVQPAAHQTPISPTTVLSNTPTQLQVQENPEVIVKEEPNTLTISPPRSTTQHTEHRSTTSTTPLPVLPLSSTESLPTAPESSVDQYGSRNRLRGKNRRRRPRPNSTNEANKSTNDDHSAYLHQQDTVRERPTIAASTSTTERNLQRTRTGNRGRPQSRPSEDLPSADPTLRVIQRNSVKSRFNSVVKNAQNRQPTEFYSPQTVEYHPPSLKTTLPTEEEDVDTPEQDTYLSTTAAASEDDNVITALQQDTNNLVFNALEETTVLDTSIDEPAPELSKQPHVEPSLSPDTSSIQTPAPSTEQIVLNQTPQETISETTKPAEDVDQHVSHRQRYRYKLKTTPETIVEPEAVPSEEPKEVIFSSSSSTTSNDVPKGVTRLRPANKYRSQDRPRFSVKDYRQRVRSTTTTSTAAPSYSSTSGYNRSRLRFPTRKRLLPSLRNRGSTTERSVEPETNDEQADYNSDDRQSSSNEGQQVATVTSTTTSQSSSSRRVSIRRGSNNRYRGSTSTTEPPAVSNEEVDRKPPVRQWSRDRYNHRPRFSTSTTESAVQVHQINLNPEDLNNIAVDTESSAASSTTESRPETAIMKISKSDHSNKQSSESFDDDGKAVTADDLNQSPSEQSERVAQLTLSGSSHKFNNLSKNNLSRRIPGYFTIATEDPILPIEAFFPNVKNISNRNR